MADWFVARSGQQQGPLTDDALRAMIAGGEVSGDDVVWRDGLPQWMPSRAVPEWAGLFPAAVPQPLGYSQQSFSTAAPPALTERGLDMLRATAPWVRLIGILIIIAASLAACTGALTLVASVAGFASGTNGGAAAGVLTTLVGLIYVVFAVLYLMPGIYLNRYASRISALVHARREDLLEQALEAQKSFWKFVGILVLLSIALWLVMVVAFFVIIGMVGWNHSGTGFAPMPTPVLPSRP